MAILVLASFGYVFNQVQKGETFDSARKSIQTFLTESKMKKLKELKVL